MPPEKPPRSKPTEPPHVKQDDGQRVSVLPRAYLDSLRPIFDAEDKESDEVAKTDTL